MKHMKSCKVGGRYAEEGRLDQGIPLTYLSLQGRGQCTWRSKRRSHNYVDGEEPDIVTGCRMDAKSVLRRRAGCIERGLSRRLQTPSAFHRRVSSSALSGS